LNPELIEFCPAAMKDKCKGPNCAIVLGVVGTSANKISPYRVKGFKQTNKLISGQPVNGTLKNTGDYQYFWFSDSSVVSNAQAKWNYDIAVSVGENG
jgi:hypothetical protein